MKIRGQKMQVTLRIHGQEKTFSEQDLIAILEKHFSNEDTEQATTPNVAKVPTEDQWFEVNPQVINQSLFREKRKDAMQEKTRKLILDAFAEAKSSPEKYGRKFKTMMPKSTWAYREFKTVEELKQLACKIGDHNADWVEQALEWAQRICNGELWEAVCNNADTAMWHRIILWKNGHYRHVGGSRNNYNDYPASHVDYHDYHSSHRINHAVPLVVLYEK